MLKKDVNRALKRALADTALSRKEIAIAADVYPSHLDAIGDRGTVPGVVAIHGILKALGLRLVLGDAAGRDLEVPDSEPKRRKFK